MTVDFQRKNTRACRLEQTYLPSLYHKLADRWELAQGESSLALYAQTRTHIDAVLVVHERPYGIEHKFIFYNRTRPHNRNVTIETLQNSTNGTPGWSLTTQADYILFAFEPAPGEKLLEVYLVPWCKLKVWFTEYARNYRLLVDHTSPNEPEFRVVPIAHIERAIPETRHYNIHQNEQSSGCTCLLVRRTVGKIKEYSKLYQDS